MTEAWQSAAQLARALSSTTKQRDRATEMLSDACAAADELAASGAIASAEARLLAREAGNLRSEIHRNPPEDNTVACYDVEVIHPATESFERLAQRLPILRDLAEEQKLSPEILSRTLPAIENDLRTITEPTSLQGAPLDVQRVAQLRAEAAAEIAKIRELVGELPPPPDPLSSGSE